jgi:hypothetical protein
MEHLAGSKLRSRAFDIRALFTQLNRTVTGAILGAIMKCCWRRAREGVAIVAAVDHTGRLIPGVEPPGIHWMHAAMRSGVRVLVLPSATAEKLKEVLRGPPRIIYATVELLGFDTIEEALRHPSVAILPPRAT